MLIQTASRRRDFNMYKAGLLVVLMALGLCLSAGQHDNEIAADDADVHSLMVPASDMRQGEEVAFGGQLI